MEKHEKVASFSCRGRNNLRIYSSYSLPDVKNDQKRFIRIPLWNDASRHFLVNFIKRLPWKRWPLQKFWIPFWLCISKFYDCTKFHYHQVSGKKSAIIKIFNFFLFLTTLSSVRAQITKMRYLLSCSARTNLLIKIDSYHPILILMSVPKINLDLSQN